MIRSFSSSLTYGYITGRIRVLETTLITKAQWQRLYAAANLYELQTILAETVYGDALREVNNIDEAEQVLNKFLTDYYQLIDESISQPYVKERLKTFFRLKYDFVNLKSWLKSTLGQEIKWPLSRLGLIAPEQWETLTVAPEKVALTVAFQEELVQFLLSVIKSAYAKYKQYNQLQVIDAVLDEAYYTVLLKTVKQLKNDWLINLTRYLIDLANIKVVLRSLADLALAIPSAEYLISGGFLPLTELEAVSSREQLLPLLAVLPDKQLKDLARQYLITDQLAGYDYLLDTYLRTYLASAQYVVAGVEVVVAYLMLREVEVKQVRTLLLAHLTALKPDFIEQWVTAVG